jgi:hypothetical protein
MAPLLTIGLFVVLELISNNVMEPWLYGSSTGVTPFALIVAAFVWTWLWGPVGLVLATPLTVCLVVMGRHIPKLAFLSIVLSDEDALTPAEDCYQRLLRVGEQDEMELADQYLKTKPLVELFDNVFIPVVTLAGTDHQLGFLETGQLEFVEQGLSDMIDAVSQDAPAADEMDLRVCCVPARARRDQLAGDMLALLLQQKGYATKSAAPRMSLRELVAWVREADADVVCISVVAPTALIPARYLCSKLRVNFSDLKIMVGLWGRSGLAPDVVGPLEESGADQVVALLAEAMDRVAAYTPRPTMRRASAREVADMPMHP